MNESLKKLQSLLTVVGEWCDRLETSVADPRFKELKEYAKRMSSLEDEEKAEAPARD